MQTDRPLAAFLMGKVDYNWLLEEYFELETLYIGKIR